MDPRGGVWGGERSRALLPGWAPREIFFSCWGVFFVLFFVLFSSCFFDRFCVVLGCHFGVILEPCWPLFSMFFWLLFRVDFLFVLGSFWGAILGRFWSPNRINMRLCDFLIFIDFP